MEIQGRKILLADDDRYTRELLAMQLQKNGFEVEEASDGVDALDRIKSVKVDLVISDMLMPNLDGFGLCRALRADPQLKNTPVIFYTAHYLEFEDKQLASKLGVARYLQKPLAEQILIQAIDEALERSVVHGDVYSLIDTLAGELTAEHQARTLNQLNLKLHQLEAAERARQQQNVHYHNILTAAPDAIIVSDTEGSIIDANTRVQELLGYLPQDLIGQSIDSLVPKNLAQQHKQHRLELISSSKSVLYKRRRDPYMALCADGTLIPVEINVGVSRSGGKICSTAIIRDLRPHQEYERQIQRLGQLYNMLSSCNQSLVHASSEAELLESFCQQIIEIGAFPLAWVAYTQHDDRQSVRMMAAAGEGQGFLKRLDISWGDNPRGQDPLSKAIRSGQVVVANRLQDDPGFPVMGRARVYDYRSALALPLTLDGATIGALVIYSTKEIGFQDEQEQRLFDELATDLSYGIGQQRAKERRTEAERALQLYYRALAACNDGVMITDQRAPGTPIIYANQSLLDMTGYTVDELVGKSPKLLQADDDDQPGLAKIGAAVAAQNSESVQLRNYRKDGVMFWSDTRIAPVLDGDSVSHYIGVCSDISENISYQQALEKQANFDVLTGLANRNLLKDRLQQAINQSKRRGDQVALLFLDLDRFKNINDSLGHAYGDQILRTLGERFKSSLRSGDTAARWGGDEFVFILTDIRDRCSVIDIIQQLLERLSQPISVEGRKFICEGSIGCSLYPGDGDDFDALLRYADSAMYQAKKRQGNSLCFYEFALNEEASGRLDLEIAMREGLERDEFFLHYQPQVEAAGHKIIGVEALVRWERPGHGVLHPTDFIPVSETTGLIIPLGRWVLRHACLDYMRWTSGNSTIRLAVNVSYRQVADEQFVADVTQILQETGMPPKLLELEITEGVMLQGEADVLTTLAALKDLGIELSLDDFGTGFSSLSYLQKFPFDTLKIDRSFVMRLLEDRSSKALCQAIVAMAQALGLRVVAEGVETSEQSDMIMQMDGDQQQGFYFFRPLPAHEIGHLIH